MNRSILMFALLAMLAAAPACRRPVAPPPPPLPAAAAPDNGYGTTSTRRHYTDEGILIGTLNQPMERVLEVLPQAVGRFGVDVEDSTATNTNARLDGMLGTGEEAQRLAIDLTSLSPHATRIAIKIGMFGNRQASNAITDEIVRRLDGPVAAVPPDEVEELIQAEN